MWKDIVYFPYVTRIIGAYLKVAVGKPDPERVSEIFHELPREIGAVSNTKGILSLAPSAVENLVLPEQGRDMLSAQYGHVDEKWDHHDKYDNHHEQVHTETTEKRVLHFLDGKLGWPVTGALVVATLAGATNMHHKRFRKMLIQNATFCCMLLAVLALVIKLRKLSRKYKPKARRLPQLPPPEPVAEEEPKEEEK